MEDKERADELIKRLVLWLNERREVGEAKRADESGKCKGYDVAFNHKGKEFKIVGKPVLNEACESGFVPYETLRRIFHEKEKTLQLPPIIAANLMPDVWQHDYIVYLIEETGAVYVMFPKALRELILSRYKEFRGYSARRIDAASGCPYTNIGVLIPIEELEKTCMMGGVLPELPKNPEDPQTELW